MSIDDFRALLIKLKNNFNYLEEVDAVMKEVLPYKPNTVVSYHPASMIERLKKIEDEKVEQFKKIIIIGCIEKNWNYFFEGNYTPAVLGFLKDYLKRVKQNCEDPEGWKDINSDLYWKELAIARRLMFPSGAQSVEKYSGFSIKQCLHLGRLDTLSFIKYLALNGGNKGYYQTHIYSPGIEEFTEEGWYARHIRLAEMIKINAGVKGTFGTSWLNDPQLLTVSPHLKYLQDIPLKNGAKRFYVGVDESDNALVTSKTRIRLNKEGKYTPQLYLLIWPREDIIAWADKCVKNKSIEV